jgi:hypothetical protein
LSGAVDGGETHAQNGSDFFISRSFCSVEQHMGSCHFARGRFSLLEQAAKLFVLSRR